jgi:hypothetical protein
MGPHAEKAKLVANDAIVTGSIVRIYAGEAASIADLSFGKQVVGDAPDGTNLDIVHSTTTTAIPIAAGSYLEGPILQFQGAGSGGVMIVYYNGGSLTIS